MKRDNGNEKNMIKNVKKTKMINWEQNEKNRRKLQFSNFWRIFAALEAHMIKKW